MSHSIRGIGTVVTSISARRRCAIQVLFLFTGLLAGSADAASSGAVYDMNRFLNEPNPFDRSYSPATKPPPLPVAERPAPLPADPVQAAQAPAPAPRPAAPPATTLAPVPARPVAIPSTMASPPAYPTPSAARLAERPIPPFPAAQPAKEPDGWRIFSEVRGGLLAHDVGPFSHQKEDGVDINGEILFASPRFMDIIWSPRPTVGATINTVGDTSQGYLGLTWEWGFWEHAFFSFFWGAAAHDGEKNANVPDKKDLGCSVLFREGIDFGWRFDERQSVMAHFSHISNAKICDSNEGLETVGVRYGYRF
jgi:lipid A 3-O-deacylase